MSSSHQVVTSKIEQVEFNEAMSGDLSGKIVISDALESDSLVRAFVKHNCSHWIQKNENYFSEDLLLAQKISEDAVDYFQKNNQFIIGNETSSIAILFDSSTSKEEVRQKVSDFISSLKPATVKASIEAIFEEMYMNATYDAPREAHKNGLGIPFNQNELILSYNDRYFVISCRDYYASLNMEKCFNRMNEVYSRGIADSINMKQGTGAGIGCVIMLEHSHSLIFGLWKGKMTKVSAVVPVNISNKERGNLKKNLHRIVKS